MNTCKVSVIIPAYNCRETIEKCVNSILQQKIENLEVIIVNDGSTDGTDVILNKIKKIDDRVTVISQKNSGVSSARNTGVKSATGDYILFVDSDDELERDSIHKLLKIICENNYDYLVANHRMIIDDKKNSIIPNLPRKEYKDNKEIWNNIIELLNSGTINPPWGKIYKSEIIKKNNIIQNPNLSIGEDLQFNLDYLEYVNSAIFLPDVMYVYNTQNSYLTKCYRENMYGERIQAINLLKTHLDKHKLDDSICLFLIIKLAYACIMQEITARRHKHDRIAKVKEVLRYDEVEDALKNYNHTGITDRILLVVLKTGNAKLIDSFSGILVALRKVLNNKISRMSV